MTGVKGKIFILVLQNKLPEQKEKKINILDKKKYQNSKLYSYVIKHVSYHLLIFFEDPYKIGCEEDGKDPIQSVVSRGSAWNAEQDSTKQTGDYSISILTPFILRRN